MFTQFNKKAVHPVVAVSLLLVVSVIAVVGFQSWFTEFSSSTLTNVETQTSKQATELKIEGLFNNQLYLKNSNTNNVKNSNLIIQNIKIRDKTSKQICGFSNTPITSNSSNSNLYNNLQGHWKFDTDNNILKDHSKNNIDGELYTSSELLANFDNNFSTQTNYGYTITDPNGGVNCSVSGISGNGCEFTIGGAERLTITNPKNFDLTSNSIKAFSIWFNYYGSPGYQATIFGKTTSNTWQTGQGYGLIVSDYKQLSFSIIDENNNKLSLESGANSINFNQWNHAIVQFNNGNYSLYLNGVLVDKNDTTSLGNFSSTSVLRLGAGGWGKYFNGKLDEFAVYDKVLTQSEINNLYTSKKVKYLELTGNSIKFDGINDYIELPQSSHLSNFDDLSVIITYKTQDITRSYPKFLSSRIENNEFIFFGLDKNNQYLGISNSTPTEKWTTSKVTHRYLTSEIEKNKKYKTIYTYNGTSKLASIYNSPSQVQNVTMDNWIPNKLQKFYIGTDGNTNTNYFDGEIYDIQIYNKVLSNQEINLMYLNQEIPIQIHNNSISKYDISLCNLDKNQIYDVLIETNSGIIETILLNK